MGYLKTFEAKEAINVVFYFCPNPIVSSSQRDGKIFEKLAVIERLQTLLAQIEILT